MRRGTLWALGATLLLSAFSLWWEPRQQKGAAVDSKERPAVRASAGSVSDGNSNAKEIAAEVRTAEVALPNSPSATIHRASVAAVPTVLDRSVLEPAKRDPFVLIEPPARAAPVPPQLAAELSPPPSPPPAPQEPPTPTVAPPPYRYLGEMRSPAGERLVYLTRGDDAVVVGSGSRLAEGYVVQSVGAESIKLSHPALGVSVELPIPRAQSR